MGLKGGVNFLPTLCKGDLTKVQGQDGYQDEGVACGPDPS